MQKRSLLYIGNKLSQKGIPVTSIETLGNFLEKEGFCVYKFSDKKNKLFRLVDMLWNTFVYARKVTVVLIDVYSTQNFYFALAVANLCRLLKVPYIPILRGGNLPERLERSWAQSKKLFHGAKMNVAPSPYLLEAFQNKGFQNLTYIPNSIEIINYPFLKRKVYAPKLLWVRAFADIYNPILALEVLEKLIETHPGASLCMVGPDKDGSLQKCKRFAEDNQLPVTFTGKLSKEDWIDLSTDYDIFLNTTNFDNTPVSVIEAMALGLPVITTNVGGIPYLVQNEKEAILVPPNDAHIFYQKIIAILETPEAINEMTERARKKEERFDWQKVKELWLALLKE